MEECGRVEWREESLSSYLHMWQSFWRLENWPDQSDPLLEAEGVEEKKFPSKPLRIIPHTQSTLPLGVLSLQCKWQTYVFLKCWWRNTPFFQQQHNCPPQLSTITHTVRELAVICRKGLAISVIEFSRAFRTPIYFFSCLFEKLGF